MELVWAEPTFRKTFIAPFVHHNYPDSNVFSQNESLIFLADISWFTLMRLSYAPYRDQFHDLKAHAPPQMQTQVDNLIALMEFFIPVVRKNINKLISD